ncbi:MAG: alanine--glyoxylate aminotransferase family protein [Methanocellales archaeon]
MNHENELLMIPGPVPVLPRILRAMSKPMIHHRLAEFASILAECEEVLKEVFKTKNDVFILSGSGTAGMEAAVCNVIDREDKLVCVVNGKFGERFKEIGDRYGKTISVEFEWGSPIELEKVEQALEDGATAITLVHNETSTGILNPAREIAKLSRKHGALFIMDGITSIGGDDVRVDEWGVDIAICGSQKCLGMPPGLAMVSVSERAWSVINEKPRRYYLDLRAYKKSRAKSQTPYTPALPLFFALQEACRVIKEEGLEQRIKRHRQAAKAIREAAIAMGLELFPKLNAISSYSNTVTAIKLPPGVSDKEFRASVRKKGVIIAGGQEQLSGKIFRIGSMGNFTNKEILTTVQAVELTLREFNVLAEFGSGVEAAQRILKEA